MELFTWYNTNINLIHCMSDTWLFTLFHFLSYDTVLTEANSESIWTYMNNMLVIVTLFKYNDSSSLHWKHNYAAVWPILNVWKSLSFLSLLCIWSQIYPDTLFWCCSVYRPTNSGEVKKVTTYKTKTLVIHYYYPGWHKKGDCSQKVTSLPVCV